VGASALPRAPSAFIEVGERIDVELTAYPGETFHGKSPPHRRTRWIRRRAPSKSAPKWICRGKLRPEMYGTIRHTDSMKTLPVVPVGAVLQGDGKTWCGWKSRPRSNPWK